MVQVYSVYVRGVNDEGVGKELPWWAMVMVIVRLPDVSPLYRVGGVSGHRVRVRVDGGLSAI